MLMKTSNFAQFLAFWVATLLTACGIDSQSHAQPLPPASEYVTVQNGHLSVRGERRRFWAAIGKLYISPGIETSDTPAQRAAKIENSRRGTDALLDRFSLLGFNAFRLWNSSTDENYQVGDGSAADALDYFVAQAGKRGFKIWVAGLNRVGSVTPGDADIVSQPATDAAWRAGVAEAVASNKNQPFEMRNNPARIWDERIEALAISRMKAIATHRNQHNGLRWCDDPTFGVWELSNEEWWMRRMLGGNWQKLPPFFRQSLVAKWNGFLKTKYQSDAALKTAWKEVLAGESLEKGSILLAPMAGNTPSSASLNDASEIARAALQGVPQTLSRDDFAPQRGSDVLEFLMGLQLAHKKREAAALKPLGRSLSLSPMIFDTGIGYEIQSQFLHQNADAVAHDAYVNGWGPEFKAPDVAGKTPHQRDLANLSAERLAANSGRWVNWLLKPPGISQGVPWLEQNRIEGKPYLVYETQIQQPAKYRADFPLRIAALAGIQDWDWICWHYFAPGDDIATNPRAFDKPLDVTTGSHPQGYHFTYDETQNATMRAAAQIFRGGLLQSAPRPTRFVYGRRSLYDPASMTYAGSYGRSGLDMLQTTYQHGVRLQIDPTRETDAVIGPVVSFDDRNKHNPYRPTREIEFDWKKGFLRLDAPAVKAWTGLLARYGDEVRFGNGVTLQNVRIINPPGIFDRVREDEKYLAFALQSHDGKPLETTRSASLTLVSTSYNSDFQMGEAGAKALSQQGHLPVLTARVGATLQAKALNGMHYVLRDWHFSQLGAGVISQGRLEIPANLPVFMVELRR